MSVLSFAEASELIDRLVEADRQAGLAPVVSAERHRLAEVQRDLFCRLYHEHAAVVRDIAMILGDRDNNKLARIGAAVQRV